MTYQLNTGILLIADDDPEIQHLLTVHMADSGMDIASSASVQETAQKVQSIRDQLEVILLDLQFGDGNALEILPDITGPDSDYQIIVMTASQSIDAAVQAMKYGVFDYVTKPLDIERLKRIADHAKDFARANRKIRQLKQEVQDYRFENLIGDHPSMRHVFERITRIKDYEISVHITGESGVGKDLIAHALHANGMRNAHPFVAINCAAIPENLFESELFGHEKGAFTGADFQRIGKIEQAHQGTLFLDEIGELTLEIQAKLLRVLENKIVQRVGGAEDITSDFRLISASNRDLEQMVEEGKFREDLYYRIASFPLYIPPLRDRQEDIPALAMHFIEHFNEKNPKHISEISKDALRKLTTYKWPGNVRELKNAIQFACTLSDDSTIRAGDLPDTLQNQRKSPAIPGKAGNTIPIHDSMTFDEIEKTVIKTKIASGDAMNSIAEKLGISRATLYRKIKNYDKTFGE